MSIKLFYFAAFFFIFWTSYLPNFLINKKIYIPNVFFQIINHLLLFSKILVNL